MATITPPGAAPEMKRLRAATAVKKKPLAMVSSDASHESFVQALGRRGHERAAGGVHQPVKAAERGRGVGHQAFGRRRPARVAGHCGGERRAGRAQRADLRVGLFAGRSRRHADGGAVCGEVERERAAEPVHAADHEDAGAGDVHAGSPRCSYSSVAMAAMAGGARAWRRLAQALAVHDHDDRRARRACRRSRRRCWCPRRRRSCWPRRRPGGSPAGIFSRHSCRLMISIISRQEGAEAQRLSTIIASSSAMSRGEPGLSSAWSMAKASS